MIHQQRRPVIVQPGQKLPTLGQVDGDFSDWILSGMGHTCNGFPVIKPHLGEPLPDPALVTAAIVTGSGAMVDGGQEWIEPSAQWLRQLVEQDVPVLGICFGHQLLAHALGGSVADNPNGIEVGSVTTRLTPEAAHDPLFEGFPPKMRVQASHRQAVIALPRGAVRLAASHQDPNHAFRYGGNTWGVQFHPEFDRTITRAYIDYYRGDLENSGRAVEHMILSTEELYRPRRLLRRFERRIPLSHRYGKMLPRGTN